MSKGPAYPRFGRQVRCSYARCHHGAVSFRAVLLDVGGVFLVPRGELVSAALAEVGAEFGDTDFKRAHFAGIAAVDRGVRGRHDTLLYLQGYVEALGVRARDQPRALDTLLRLWGEPRVDLWSQPIPESVRGLRRLANRDIPLGIVSNSDGTVEERLRRQRICQVGPGDGVQVLVIVDSSVVGVEKPDPQVFAPAIDALGLPVDEVAFVGDSVRYDVEGSENAGLLPIHFDPYHACQSHHPHRDIVTLDELVA
jgi:FMN phosphatase YigB (HAD superfamily)